MGSVVLHILVQLSALIVPQCLLFHSVKNKQKFVFSIFIFKIPIVDDTKMLNAQIKQLNHTNFFFSFSLFIFRKKKYSVFDCIFNCIMQNIITNKILLIRLVP